MNMKFKYIFLIITLLINTNSCQDSSPAMHPERIHGTTMGTTYHITYEQPASSDKVYTYETDSVLNFVNDVASTYIPSSIISRLNKGDTLSTDTLDKSAVAFFRKNTEISHKVWEWSDGYFDPTVMPLINYWGFGYEGHRPVEEVDSFKVDSLLELVGLDRLMDFSKEDIWYLPQNMQLDFSAVAKGAACDVLGEFFEKRGITNYLIDIGGETLAKGPGRSGSGWIIGINQPEPASRGADLAEELAIRNLAVATSGNYQNFYKTETTTYGHTINPHTGYPEINNVLSATVITTDCGMADALATALMAMGLEKSKTLLKNLPDTEAFLIYNNDSEDLLIYETEGMKKLKHIKP